MDSQAIQDENYDAKTEKMDLREVRIQEDNLAKKKMAIKPIDVMMGRVQIMRPKNNERKGKQNKETAVKIGKDLENKDANANQSMTPTEGNDMCGGNIETDRNQISTDRGMVAENGSQSSKSK